MQLLRGEINLRHFINRRELKSSNIKKKLKINTRDLKEIIKKLSTSCRVERKKRNIKSLITISPRSLIKQTDDENEREISYQRKKQQYYIDPGKKKRQTIEQMFTDNVCCSKTA